MLNSCELGADNIREEWRPLAVTDHPPFLEHLVPVAPRGEVRFRHQVVLFLELDRHPVHHHRILSAYRVEKVWRLAVMNILTTVWRLALSKVSTNKDTLVSATRNVCPPCAPPQRLGLCRTDHHHTRQHPRQSPPHSRLEALGRFASQSLRSSDGLQASHDGLRALFRVASHDRLGSAGACWQPRRAWLLGEPTTIDPWAGTGKRHWVVSAPCRLPSVVSAPCRLPGADTIDPWSPRHTPPQSRPPVPCAACIRSQPACSRASFPCAPIALSRRSQQAASSLAAARATAGRHCLRLAALPRPSCWEMSPQNPPELKK